LAQIGADWRSIAAVAETPQPQLSIKKLTVYMALLIIQTGT